MAEQVDIFNEKKTGRFTLDFTDEDGVAIVPDSATYTLYDEVSGNIINSRNQTNIVGLATSVNLKLVPNDNVIVNSDEGNYMEAHILFVEWVYNSIDLGGDEHRFFVRNLTKVP